MSKEVRFQVGGKLLAAQQWGEPGQFPVIALHGWLDNSASFFRLAPLLEGMHIVAPDMAGHGQSDYRSGPYNIWQDVGEVFAVADQLGWEQFALIGHSRGAIVSALAAGTFPERITHAGLIDGLWPEPVMASDAPQQLARSITEMNRYTRHKQMVAYPDTATAIKARADGLFPVSLEAASALAQRGLALRPEGYTWSYDPSLRAASAVKLTQDQIEAFIRRITAPVRLVLAKEGLIQRFEQYQENLALFANIQVEILPGGHHLHMESESLKIADYFRVLFSEGCQEG